MLSIENHIKEYTLLAVVSVMIYLLILFQKDKRKMFSKNKRKYMCHLLAFHALYGALLFLIISVQSIDNLNVLKSYGSMGGFVVIVYPAIQSLIASLRKEKKQEEIPLFQFLFGYHILFCLIIVIYYYVVSFLSCS